MAVLALTFVAPATSAQVTKFTEHVISTDADRAYSVFAADVDGDGDMDVLSASREDDKIAWYENDGGSPPVFTERVISTTADEAHFVFAVDVDGDGDMDVLSASQLDDKIAWYENIGGSPPVFIERVISTAVGRAASVFAADLDGDGDMDVLSASHDDDKIAWYENNGGSPPVFVEQVISTANDGALSVFAADMDGDGDMDVLSASKADDKIAWYEHVGEPPSIPGDLDGDGTVGPSDLLILLASWGPCADCDDCPADLDGDCTVSAADLLILLANWG